ncbi:MAG TPA: EamA family transporter [Thermoplasmata archaeon]|nr:EamA family transporter [Thermoplasmata archaeon]
MRSSHVDVALLLATGTLWGSAFIAIRAGILAGASPFLYAEVRLVLAAAIMAAVALANREARPPTRELVRSALLGALFLMGGYSLLLYWGEQSTPGSLATILVATAPLVSALFAYPLIPAERFGALGLSGILLGFVGVATIFLPRLSGSPEVDLLGALAVFGAGTLFAFGSVVLRRLGGGRQGYWHMTGQFAASAILVGGAVAATAGTERFPVTAITVGTVLYLAVGSSVLGYGLYFRLHHRVGPQQANAVAYVNPVVGVLLGIALLGESIAWFEVAGFALVVGGLALLHWERQRRAEKPRPGLPR